jgi:FkbM family methyltransferase
MNNFYSQYGEEIFLLEYFKDINGFLVEIGAADGTANSNSRRLLELGWGGLLVEPNKKNYNLIYNLHKDNNKVFLENCGCSNTTEEKKFYIDLNDQFQQLSTYSTDQVEACKSIFSCEFIQQDSKIIKTQELFDKYNIEKINFLSIDTESYDQKVLDGINFDKTDITLICIEQQDLDDFFIKNNYKLIYKTIGNKFYEKITC